VLDPGLGDDDAEDGSRVGDAGDVWDELLDLQLVRGLPESSRTHADFSSLIHLYFVGTQLRESLSPGSSYPLSCPQCHNSSFSVGSIRLAGVAAGLKDGYAPLLDGEGEPRRNMEESRAVEDGEMV
jgi:hypothetical protein